ncbi:glycosyltransferase [Frankia sp. AiPs1]|uniref:glycosyltransferase n=1 Tax=Frankia sp. AiPs1 TaxID=573493 RepID=UPI002043C2D4|nr:glycosyltransferase [Frankia sp. AiPs1]MCM3922729.1 glycosyltransferase [Frankia sp. AiPs1]
MAVGCGESVLWGISFDATPISGVVVEFVKTARIFQQRGYRVHLDLGYDVKADKNVFFQPYRDEAALLPDWVRLARIDGLDSVPGYDAKFATAVLREVVQAGDERLLPRVEAIAEQISHRIVDTWRRRGVSFVLVENGTLPENITYTRAVYLAIERYGREEGLGRFVLWRDHDLMWQSEPAAGKYGIFPYPHAVAPVDSPHIQYLVQHAEARRRMLHWQPDLHHLAVLPNTFSTPPAAVDEHNAGFRRDYGIPAQAILIARPTRLIPQKRIDRDLHLLAALHVHPRLPADIYLFVTGDRAESPAEYVRLAALARRLGVADRVVFGGWLAPHAGEVGRPAGHGYSVQDLFAHADLVSFLTSGDYESYGNPIGEAVAAGVPYITTGYDLYDLVYGSVGFQAPVMDLAAGDLPTPPFVDAVADLLVDAETRRRTVAVNQRLGARRLACSRRQVRDLLDRMVGPATAPRPTPMDAGIRMSVVLPVYNEAANLPAVLASLYGQRGDDGMPLRNRVPYEVVVVDNNSTDTTVEVARRFAAAHPDLPVQVIQEGEQGVACARRAGMQFAVARSRARADAEAARRFYLVSADADCRVDPTWLWELFVTMEAGKAAIGVCDYYYRAEHFAGRPRLWAAIDRTLRCRAVTFRLFGGFPDGKGFAVERGAYEKVGGIEIFYQVQDGRFVPHLSDDWDFGISVRGSGEEIVYAPRSRVEINPRRVDHALAEVIAGRAYGHGGTIVMRDIRDPDLAADGARDLTAAQARQAWEFSVRDFTPKNTILPVLLTPSLLDDDAVADFFTPSLARRLSRRIAEILDEMRVVDLTPIHAYKTPSYRLYFEFADEIFARLRATVGSDIGRPPPLPTCLREVPDGRFREFVRYYCEDRESGAAHDHFGNGGVF